MESSEKQNPRKEMHEQLAEWFEITLRELGKNSEAVKAYQRLIATQVERELSGTGGAREKARPIDDVGAERAEKLRGAIESHPDVVLYKELELALADMKKRWEA